VNGAKENAIYNVDIACMVVDNEKQYQKCSHQDGFVKERPASYPSGHSAQIWMLGILISQMDVKNIETYMKKCYEDSVNRSVGRFHWNSDCMIGRLFGTMSIPLIMAMDGMRSGFEDMQKRIQNQDTKTTELGQDININISIKNNSKGTVTLSGEINFVLANPDIYGNYYGWKGIYNRTGRIKFNNQSVTMTSGSEKKFCNIHCPEMGLRNLLDGSKMS
jgi:hypothetical protein